MAKRIVAIAGIVILVGMYIVTLILAIMNNELSNRFFTASIVCTVVIPVLIWVFQWLYKMVKKDAEEARNIGYDTTDISGNAGNGGDSGNNGDAGK